MILEVMREHCIHSNKVVVMAIMLLRFVSKSDVFLLNFGKFLDVIYRSYLKSLEFNNFTNKNCVSMEINTSIS